MFGAFIAARAKQPLLALDDDETKAIAESASNVARFYDVPVSPVTQAWMAFAGTIGSIYWAKITVIRMNKTEAAGA